MTRYADVEAMLEAEKKRAETAEVEVERLRGEIVENLIKRVELIDAAIAREKGAYQTAEEHLNRAETAEARCRELETLLKETNAHLAWARADGKWYEAQVRKLRDAVKQYDTCCRMGTSEHMREAYRKMMKIISRADAALAASAPGEKEPA
jgi:hypothetical protein